MGTVRDRAELGAALRGRAGEIEVRGVLARQLVRGRMAACLTALCSVAVLVMAATLGGMALWQGDGFAPGARLALVSLLAVLAMIGSAALALHSSGMAAFSVLRGYRAVHRSQGVVVLRRK